MVIIDQFNLCAPAPVGTTVGVGVTAQDEESVLVLNTDPLGGTVAFGYTGGNLTSLTTGDGRVSTLAYNPSGRVVLATGPDGRQLAFGYDGAQHVTSITESNNRTTTFPYYTGEGAQK